MKNLIRFFIKKEPATLEECSDFEVKKDDANTLFGGFKEYKPLFMSTIMQTTALLKPPIY